MNNTRPSFAEVLGLSFKVGVISFGGPAAQIAILQEELVERRGWIDQPTFLRALNFCMLLPGPEAQQLATYLGYKLHGIRGALAAGGLFILPGAAVMFGLAWLAAAHGAWPPLQAVFSGLLPIAAALVLHAVWRIGGRSLKTPAAWALAIGAFVAVMAKVSFPLVVIAALAIGVVLDRFGIAAGQAGHAPPGGAQDVGLPDGRSLLLRFLKYTAGFLVAGALPVFAILLVFGTEPFGDVASLFTKAAFVTFGGAYAVLPYVAQAAVEYGWLSPEAMAQGLALAETTPGPLILITEYVGFFAGWHGAAEAGLAPLAAASIAAGLTLWCTFLPSFYFVLAGAPLIETLTHQRWAAAALSGVTSAVVGVIASLAVTIGTAAFLPDGRVDIIAIVLAAAALLALIRFKLSPLVLVVLGGGAGIIRWLAGV